MLKVKLCFVLLVSGSFFLSDSAFAANAYSVSVFGTGLNVEQEVVEEVDFLVISGYQNKAIDTIITEGYGVEGGKKLCIQKANFAPDEAIDALANSIWNLPHDPSRTEIKVHPVRKCVKLR